MYKILLIEDDHALAMGTKYSLKSEGFEVIGAKNIAEARTAIKDFYDEINLILLDVMLPDGDGFSFMKELYENNTDIPVIFVTAVGDEANIVLGLDLGADDYITKPYRVKELISRIKAVLRRQERNRNNSLTDINIEKGDSFIFGSHRYVDSTFRLYKGNELIECTPAELRLLREFIHNNGIILTRNQLLERLYDNESSFVDDNTLSVYIKRLRDKLGEDADCIKTVKGIGYRFEIKE